jgi:hypothetical protein
MARSGHGLPKVPTEPAMPYPSAPCGWVACLPFSSPLDTPRRTLMIPSPLPPRGEDDPRKRQRQSHLGQSEMILSKDQLYDMFQQAGATVRQTMVRNNITDLIVTKNTKYAMRVASPQAADRSAGGWPPEGRIIMTP